MRLAELFRLTALGIALLCWLDPPIVVAPQPRVPVDVALLDGPRAGRPADNSGVDTVASRLRDVARQIAGDLDGEADLRVHEGADPGHPPCDAVRPCVLVMGPGVTPELPPDRRGLTSLVRVGADLSPNVEVTDVEAQAPHVGMSGLARVRLEGRGVAGQETRVRVYDGPAMVGETVHVWEQDGRADAEIDWWPLAAGPRRLEVRVDSAGVVERTDVDNRAAAPVVVGDGRWPVLVFERRPSWAATFARRALEEDGRFDLASRTDVAPRIVAARSAAEGLTDQALERAHVAVIGAPDALTADDVDRLERFVRRRGGAVILVPDRGLGGPVSRLVRHRWREQLAEAPQVAGELRASEWLLASEPVAPDEVVRRADGEPAIVTTPSGAGRVTVVGAMDAWRHREADEGYRRFWHRLVGREAAVAGPALEVRVAPPWAAPGEALAVDVRARRVRAGAATEATAEWQCEGETARPLRLWPGPGAGALVARVSAPTRESSCAVVIRADGLGEARAAVAVSGDAVDRRIGAAAAVEGLARRTGGVVTTADELAPLYDSLRTARPSDRVPERRHPMRSWWWLPPFVACLAAEWWLRRHAGLR